MERRWSLHKQIAQRGCVSPTSGNVQGQMGWGSEKPNLVKNVPAYSRWLGTR